MSAYNVCWCGHAIFNTSVFVIWQVTISKEADLEKARLLVAFVFFLLLAFFVGTCLDLLIIFSYNKHSIRLSE